MTRALAVLLAVLVFAVAACGDDRSPSATTSNEEPAAAPFSRRGVLRCLRREGVTVSAVPPGDAQLRSLTELAQGGVAAIRLDGGLVALGFTPDVAAAELLVELVTLPDARYEPSRRGNVVLLVPISEPPPLEPLSECVSA